MYPPRVAGPPSVLTKCGESGRESQLVIDVMNTVFGGSWGYEHHLAVLADPRMRNTITSADGAARSTPRRWTRRS